MKHYKIIYFDGGTEVHCQGFSDYALCGHDLAGDHAYDPAQETTDKINCLQCISVIQAAKKIRKSQISNIVINTK